MQSRCCPWCTQATPSPGQVLTGSSWHVCLTQCAGEAQVDAHALLLTCCVAIYMGFPFGMSTAATIRVGNLVGANRPAEARLSGSAPAFRPVHLPFKFRTCLWTHLPSDVCHYLSGSALAFWTIILPFRLGTCLSAFVLAFNAMHMPFRV